MQHFLTGIIEGFYGRAWTWAARRSMLTDLEALGLDFYLYAPKNDPFLRKQWRERWPQETAAAIEDLTLHGRDHQVTVGLGLSPFELYRHYDAAARRSLQQKLAELDGVGADVIAILFDDMPGELPDLAERQAEIVADASAWTSAGRIMVCPTYYSDDPVLERVFGARPEGYWERLGELLPESVDVFWTGPRVCADTLAPEDVSEINHALRRQVLLWDNYPVNDGRERSEHLYCFPPPGRAVGMAGVTRGHLLNGMNQPLLTLPALLGLARLYDRSALDEHWLAQRFGERAWAALSAHRALFRDRPLSSLDPGERQALLSEFRRAGGDAAAEVCDWLSGGYEFDPACLTD
jgi:hyaluronoglucosaminidase